MTRIYTRTGDRGDTGLFGGERVSKATLRVDAYGEVDELNSVIGLATAQITDPDICAKLQLLQPDLFDIGAHLASGEMAERLRSRIPPLPDQRVQQMEQWIDEAEKELPALKAFILPGGSAGGATLHVARCVCRRAERRVVALHAETHVDDIVLRYLNRLSDLLFTYARLTNHRAGKPEVQWLPQTR